MLLLLLRASATLPSQPSLSSVPVAAKPFEKLSLWCTPLLPQVVRCTLLVVLVASGAVRLSGLSPGSRAAVSRAWSWLLWRRVQCALLFARCGAGHCAGLARADGCLDSSRLGISARQPLLLGKVAI